MSKKMILILVAIVAAAVVVAGAVLGFLFLSSKDDDQGPAEYALYWNLDGIEYYSNDELSRKANDDGTCTMRFVVDGKEVELKTESRRLANNIDSACGLQSHGLVGLVFNEEGIVVGFNKLSEMPLTVRGSMFFVQATASGKVKLNSTPNFMTIAMQTVLETTEETRIFDMSGSSAHIGAESKLQVGDQVLGVENEAGIVTHIFIIGREGLNETKVTFCQHCKEEVLWQGWLKTDTLPLETGHYYLTGDVTLTKQQQLPEEAKVCFDLNGYTVYGAYNKRIYVTFNVSSALAMMDTSEAGTGRLVINADERNASGGMGVWVRYGTFDMYGGTIDASNAVTTVYGLAVNVAKATAFNFHNGTILGGRSIKNADGKNGNAGSVCVTGVMNMNGGTISGGSSEAPGGNVSLAKGAVFNMNGGEIFGGTSKGASGGNLNVSAGAVFNMNGGTIRDGVGQQSEAGTGGVAPNIFMQGEMYMTGGLITGGVHKKIDGTVEAKMGNNLMIRGKTVISGGTITGSVRVVYAEGIYGSLALSGDVTIFGAQKGEANLRIDKDAPVEIGKMTGGKIGITLGDGSGIFTAKTEAANAKYFVSDLGSKVIHYKNCLAVGEYACGCGISAGKNHLNGCDGKKLFWEPFSTKACKTDGNYYLTSDFEGTITLKANTRIDMNGYNAYASADQRAWTVDGNVIVVNSRPTVKNGGKIVGDAKENRGGAMIVNADGVLTLRNGVTATVTENAVPTNGGTMDVAGTLRLAGGTVIGTQKATGNGKAIRLNGGVLDAQAGSVIKGDVYLHNGEIAINGSVNIEQMNLLGKQISLSEGAAVKDLCLGIITSANSKILDKGSLSETAWSAIRKAVDDGKIQVLAEDTIIRDKGDGLYCASIYERLQCLCGKHTDIATVCENCGSAVLSFVPWPYAASDKATRPESGNYYLTENITAYIQPVNGAVLNIDLNGFNWEGVSGRALQQSNAGEVCTVNICNTGTAATITGKQNAGGGGAIWVRAGMTVTLWENITVQVAEGVIPNDGGVVKVDAGAFNLKGAIINGTAIAADKKGTAVYVAAAGSFSMTSGTVNGADTGDAIYSLGGLNFAGGKVNGDVYVADGTVGVSGAVDLSRLALNGSSLVVGVMTDGASVKVDKPAGEVFVADTVENYSDIVGYVNAGYISAYSPFSSVNTDGGLSMTGKISCICGNTVTTGATCADCGTAVQPWQAWSGTTAVVEGYYYLTGDASVTISTGAGKHLAVDLNGYNWIVAGDRVASFKGTFTLLNTGLSDGTHGIVSGNMAGRGGTILVQGGTLNLYEGVTVKTAKQTYSGRGGVIDIGKNGSICGTMNLYGAVIDATGITWDIGAALCIESECSATVYSGTIIGGNANYGSAVAVGHNATGNASFTMTGGTIRNGDVYRYPGANVNISGDASIENLVLN